VSDLRGLRRLVGRRGLHCEFLQRLDGANRLRRGLTDECPRRVERLNTFVLRSAVEVLRAAARRFDFVREHAARDGDAVERAAVVSAVECSEVADR